MVLPPDLLAKVVLEALDCAEKVIANALEGQARRAGLTDAEIDPQIAQATLGESRKKLVAELTPLALQEWGLDAQLSPTVAICVLLGPWAFGAGTAYMTLAKLAKEKAALDKKAKGEASPAKN